MTEDIQVVYNGEGNIMLVLDGAGMVISRAEAEQLFVDLGHCLQDMDAIEAEEK